MTTRSAVTSTELQSNPTTTVLWTLLRRGFLRSASGATVVEFGLLALPFIALLFALLETAMFLFADQVLETATSDAACLIRTGQAQQARMSKGAFQDLICEKANALIDCEKLAIEVRTFSTFDSIAFQSPFGTDGGLDGDMDYSPGSGGEIVLVRAFYEWPLFVRLLGNDLSNTTNGTRLLAASTVFRNEAFAG